MQYLRLRLRMAPMYDAPLISPENKDSSADSLGCLPKVALAAKVAAGHSVSDAVKTVLDKLRSEAHTSELESRGHLVCPLLPARKSGRTGRGGRRTTARRA